MDPVIYILDTNVIAVRIHRLPQVLDRLTRAGEAGQVLGLCDPVRYEVLRGLLNVNATQKLRLFHETITPLMDHLALIDEDWQVAAQLWAIMRSRGRQFSDVDLLIAALAQRLNAVVVTSDNDFAALSVQREDWRAPQWMVTSNDMKVITVIRSATRRGYPMCTLRTAGGDELTNRLISHNDILSCPSGQNSVWMKKVG